MRKLDLRRKEDRISASITAFERGGAFRATLSVLPHLQAKMPCDAIGDFTAITNLIGGPSFLTRIHRFR